MRRRRSTLSYRRAPAMRGTVRLGMLFAVLIGINVYVFFFRGDKSIGELLKAGAMQRPRRSTASTSNGKKSASSSADPAARTTDALVLEGSLEGHTGLFAALDKLALQPAQIASIVKALEPKLDMRALRPSQTFRVELDRRTRKLERFSFRVSRLVRLEVTPGPGGKLRVRRRERELTTKVVRIGGRIESSLGEAMTDAGESLALVALFVDLFAYDINWYADPRPGDEFRAIVERKYLDGKFYTYGKILAAEYRGAAGRYQVYHFKRSDGRGGYYTPEGRSIERSLLKTPLRFSRISSRFSKRRYHPVLHRVRGHFGVDYAAARGTPVWAAAGGSVISAGRAGGAGNMVVLKHAGGLTTLYMHLSRFARGLHRGQKVKQRQLIGYVGATGLATGPHLHFGLKRNGRYIDPMKFNAGKGPMLPRSERNRFLDQLAERMEQLERISAGDDEGDGLGDDGVASFFSFLR